MVTNSGNVSLYLDGKLILSENNFSAEKANGSLFQIGQCSVDFGGNFEGNISNVRYWKRALDDKEAILASSKRIDETNTPDFNWKPNKTNTDSKDEQSNPSVIDGYVANITTLSVNNEKIKISDVKVSKLAEADHFRL